MKTTFNLSFVLLLLCLFSCDKNKEDLKEATTGTLILKADQAPLELIEVSNSKLAKNKEIDERVRLVIFNEKDEQYVLAEDIGQTYTLDMEPGHYRVIIESFDMSRNWQLQAWAEANFEIKAGQETELSLLLDPTYIEVQPILVNMDNSAKLWMGDKAFIPSDANKITYSSTEDGPSHRFYPGTTTIDLVLEYDGKTKRFNMPVQEGKKYIVEIVHDSEGDGDGDGEKTGSVSIDYTIKELTVERIKFKF